MTSRGGPNGVDGLQLRPFDALVHAHRFGWQVVRERWTAVRARGRAVVHDRVGILSPDAAVALVAGLRAFGGGTARGAHLQSVEAGSIRAA